MIMSEIDQIHDFVREVGDDVEVQWGAALDETLGESVRVTIIATGYEVSDIPTKEKNDLDASIEKYYGENPEQNKESLVDSQEQGDTANEVEENECLEDKVSQEIELDIHNSNSVDAEDDEVVVDLDDDNRDSLQGSLFSAIPGWMRGRR
jgi:hypothetical protein